MESDEVLDLIGIVSLSKQTERAVRAALKGGGLPGVPPKQGANTIAALRSDVLQWIRNGAPDIAALRIDRETQGDKQ